MDPTHWLSLAMERVGPYGATIGDKNLLNYRALLRYVAEEFDASKVSMLSPAYCAEVPTSVAESQEWLAAAFPIAPPPGFSAPAVRCRIDAAIAQQQESYATTLRRASAALGMHDGLAQQHYNVALRAHNVWEVVVPTAVVDQARQIFEANGLSEAFHRLQHGTRRHATVGGDGGDRFFAVRSGGVEGGMGGTVSSDITWISVDNRASYQTFERLFQQLDLDRTFAAAVGAQSRLRMYSAYFVVRSRCSVPFFHRDYSDEVGVKALTLMTPLADYRERASFQLLYSPTEHAEGSCQPEADVQHVATSASARYEYKKGSAIVLGSSFEHSTEPGAAHADDGIHAYLCFTVNHAATQTLNAHPLTILACR